jgi:adenine-specific DNA-methyltransferase
MPPSVLTPERAAGDLVAQVDSARLTASRTLDSTRKALLGQFFTPAPVARLMASMLDVAGPVIRLLDPGAGTGALFAACVAEWCRWPQPPAQVHVTAYEVDSGLIPYLRETLALCKAACEQADITFTSEVRNDDFIRDAVTLLRGDLFTPASAERYNCAILNPPYRKIQTASEHRRLLQRIGIETTNLYTGFLATTVQLLEPTGAMVAITPRSFCNGPYFKHFRRFFLGAMTLRRLHLFESRDEAFRDDAVLQENIILAAARSTGTPATIAITSSADPEDGLLSARDVPYTLVVSPDDPHAFIHIVPDALGQAINARLGALRWSLASLGVRVSTGRVVDFRVRIYLRPQP